MRFLFSRQRRQAELNEEIQSHLEMAVRDRVERGEDATQARAAAQREFGNVAVVREVTQDQWGWTWLENLFQDLYFGVRMLRKSSGLSIVAVLTLALGIGANAGVFSVVNTLLLRSLPFREPDRLTLLQNFVPPHNSAAQFHDWRRQRQYFRDAAVFEDIDANLRAGKGVIRAHVAQTSWNFFSVLGTQLTLGDGFASGDDVDASGLGLPGRNAVAVIGYGLWQELFGGSPKALGATIRVQGNPLTVIGVAPPGFNYPNKSVVWKPGAFNPGNDGWVVIGRLKSGISLARARAQFAAEASRERTDSNNLDLRPKMISLRDALLGPVKDASLMLMGAVGLVLLIACTNLAGLLMARTAERAAELSVRAAVGASRTRLARQLLTECLLLSSIAAVAGLLVALWTTSLAAKVEPPPLGAQSYSILNGSVLIFTLVASVVTAALFGVLPLLYVTRLHPFGRRGSGDVRAEGLAAAPIPESYVPYAQLPFAPMSVVVRTAVDPESMVETLTKAVQTIDKDLPLLHTKTLDEYVADSVAETRFETFLVSIFGALAFVLTCIGLYGVVSYTVVQQMREMGVRLALGAGRDVILRMVIGRGLMLSGIGISIGLAMAFLLTRFISTLLYGVSPWDPPTFFAVPTALIAMALTASYVPARRAANVDPMVALRYE